MELFIRIILAVIILIMCGLYIHVKMTETFATTIVNDQTQTISYQLTSEIAKKLGISTRRIQNMQYIGNLDNQKLSISFTILDPNIIEINNNEPNAETVANNANQLFIQNNFIVLINGSNIRLSKINTSNIDSIKNREAYFNNTGMNDISKYALQKYTMTPQDKSFTRFFKLNIDNNYNVKPILE